MRRHRSLKLPRCHADKNIPQNRAANKNSADLKKEGLQM
jgi:hypothetical protein